MELGSVIEFLGNKTILVTGTTGFLGKIVVEKILRVQPDVKKLYLLIRAKDEATAMQRFHNEVLEKDLFAVLKKRWGAKMSTLISEKICVVPGEISLPQMGLKDSNLLVEMKNQVEIIVNSAATTKFDERYDVALSTNTFGTEHVLTFTKKCPNLKVIVHVSTGEREGLILETPYQMGESLNGTAGLDIQTEQRVVEETLNELRENRATQETMRQTMKRLGLQRAKMYGWPNTYVFTKAMGEMMISQLKDNLPIVIIRPTIVTSTYKDPFPGWIEGVRTIDALIVGYGKGKLTSFVVDTNSVIDLIPADMLANTIIMTMVARVLKPSSPMIYQVGSSAKNPMKSRDLHHFSFKYFTQNPWINRDGKAIKVKKVTLFNNMASFQKYITIRHLSLLKGLEIVNKLLFNSLQDKYSKHKRRFTSGMRLVELYRPYLFFKAIFDDSNTERLRRTAQIKDTETDIFFSDPRVIDWANYFITIHIPGVVKYLFK